MLIKSIHVRNFRCIADAQLDCEPLTALVGPNGCGKSSFLHALNLFFDPTAKVTASDFFAGNSDCAIELTVTFTGLRVDDLERFSAYVVNGELVITRVIAYGVKASAQYFGYLMRNEDFLPLRNAPTATARRPLYEEIRKQGEYASLPKWSNAEAADQALKEWEGEHAECCTLQKDDGNYFNVGRGTAGDLSRLVRVVFVEAVRDAGADAIDAKGSPVTELLDVAFRARMAEREDFRQLEADTEEKYGQILEKAKAQQFREVEERLSRAMGGFIADSSIELVWHDNERVRIPPPSADVYIVEDGYRSPVSRTGHGVQRAFILSLLQELTVTRFASKSEENAGAEAGELPASLPTLLLLIEEPELFQHPNRQRSIARKLLELSTGAIKGVAEQTQVVFGTHNPHFVAIDRVEQVRALRKEVIAPDLPKATQVNQFDPISFMELLAFTKDEGDEVGDWTLHRMKLYSIMDYSVNEGLFAKAVVLVEGDIDRAGILAACNNNELNLEDSGVSVVRCRGKANLVRLSIIFRLFGIQVYMIWDADQGKAGKATEIARRNRENRELQRVVGIEPTDCLTTAVEEEYACIETDLEAQVRSELGDFYEKFMESSEERYGMSGKDNAIKHQVVFSDMLVEARAYDYTSPTLDRIVEKIAKLVKRL